MWTVSVWPYWRKCNARITLRHVHETIFAVVKQYYIFCVCVFARVRGHSCACVSILLRACNRTYPACNVHAPYCLRPLWLHHIFRHYLKNGTIFGKKLLNIKCAFWFSLQLLFETFLILRPNSARYCHKCENVVFYWNLNFLDRFSGKSANFRVRHNGSSGSRVVPCGQKDRRLLPLLFPVMVSFNVSGFRRLTTVC